MLFLERLVMRKQVDLLQGTLDMLLLKVVSLGPLHGYGILLRLRQISKEALQVPQGSLYPALYRLEQRGWIAAEWGASDKKRKAKYYRLTAAGRKQLKAERKEWKRLARAITTILKAAPPEA
jgi:PadR family transcriptional regulator